jgi:lipopolysaccharide/colanic/teichoic acid biosynthesis glycosyltransferase
VLIRYGSNRRRSLLANVVCQIAFAVILLAAQYVFIITASSLALQRADLIFETAVGCAVATMLGLFLIRGVAQYPGVEETSYLIPGFCVSYGLLILAHVLGRIEYSRIFLSTSFFVNVVFFSVLFSILRRGRRLCIGVVPEGEHVSLLEVDRITWQVLPSPEHKVDQLDAIAVDLRSDLSDAWERKLANFALQDLPVYHSKHLLESLTGKVTIEHLSENSFGTLSPLYAYMRIKHAVDFVAALAALLILSPALMLIALLIKFDSAGPVLFRQVRIGYQGRPFKVYKFRSMTVARDDDQADALEAAKTKAADLRITRVGAFLRRTRLDELPQALNVIRGEMSWIGPRPEAQILSRWYEDEIPFYRYRHIVRPGITGWAQVNQGHVAEVSDVTDKLHYDFYYIKNFSPWIDLLIVARTIRTMMTGFGSR